MPELPEVETVVRGLRETIVGLTIAEAVCRYPRINQDNRRGWLNTLAGQKFAGIRRRGKNILIDLAGGHTLWVHLKMTGHLYFFDAAAPLTRHDLLIFRLKKERKILVKELRFNDMRRFGRVRLFSTETIMEQKGLIELGPEPLEISRKDFVTLMRRRSRMIKPALLDQHFIAGIGNIYADESLYLARIHPRRLTNSLSARKAGELHGHIQQVLTSAIANMGTSVDNYAGVYGRPGGYQKYLKVYGRAGQDCPRCGAKIKREVIGSRSAHFCSHCQRL